MDGQGNQRVSGGRERRSRSSTTSLKASKVKGSDPSLYFNTTRQREGECFNQGCGERGTTSLTSGSGPCGANVSLSLVQAELLNDPEFAKNVKGLEGMLRVRDRLGETDRVCVQVRNSALQGGSRDAGAVAPGAASVGVEGGRVPLLRLNSAGGGVGCAPDVVGVRSSTASDSSGFVDLLEVHESGFSGNSADAAAHETAGESTRIAGLLEVREPEFSKKAGAAAHAPAGESERNLGLRQVIESHSRLNSSVGVARVRSASSAAVAPCAAAVALTCPLASGAVVAVHARHTVTPMHVAHYSGEACGLLPVQRSTSYNKGGGKGPTGTRSSKGGVSGPAEDLRPVSEVEAWVNFRPAGSVRGQVAGSLPGRQPGAGIRTSKGRCGHTFGPPGGSGYPIRVTWARIGHQAIDGPDEGVSNCTVGDLGAKG